MPIGSRVCMALKIVNLDRYPQTLPGYVGHPDDNAVVIDTERTERHIITGQEQPMIVYRGTLHKCHAFVNCLEERHAAARRNPPSYATRKALRDATLKVGR